jgi:hypothetical protein
VSSIGTELVPQLGVSLAANLRWPTGFSIDDMLAELPNGY